ncbi:MAG: hypothetical protein KDH89_13065 [Anaerolineae bacterium]|nr:hypothetical protein [Anaerolineae bacterium]
MVDGLFGVIEALTVPELNRRTELETTIERGLQTFVDVGLALMEIRDTRLYRADYGTFEDYCRERWGWTRQRANQLIASADVVSNLEMTTIVVKPSTESQARPLAPLSPDLQRDVWREAVDTAPNGKVTAAHVQGVVDRMTQPEPRPMAHVGQNSGESEWYTPQPFIEAARLVMGAIDLDPASSDIANTVVDAAAYFTAQDDGLSQNWYGRVWMNPPYAQPLVSQFCAKLRDEYDAGDVNSAIVLVNNATETAWFQRIIGAASAVCFPLARVKFWAPDRVAAPLQGQAVVYLGDNPALFIREFATFGWCARVV